MQSTITTRSPILFLIFNRPDTTARVFEAIRQAQPPRIYIAADGARHGKAGEDHSCHMTRMAVASIDWPCKVFTLFRDRNLGCKEAVSSAIDWFFAHEEEGIILEDDCLPTPSFFAYCDELLARYRTDTRVRHICGCNLQFGHKRGDASYYFSRLTHVWGWAGWRRAWRDYDKNLTGHRVDEISKAFANIFSESLIVERWRQIAEELQANKIDTWDYQLSLINFLQNGISAIPNVNLISNIGFGANATHTLESGSSYADIPLEDMHEISHPKQFIPDMHADLFTLNHEFKIDEARARRKKQQSKLRQLRHRVKRWIGAHGGPQRWRSLGLDR